MKPLSEEAPIIWSFRSRYKQCDELSTIEPPKYQSIPNIESKQDRSFSNNLKFSKWKIFLKKGFGENA